MAKANILIAIKDTSVAHDLSERLLSLGYRIVGFATSNEEVIADVEELNPDLVLADIHWRGVKGGIKTGTQIFSIFDKPVIYITGSVGQVTIQRSRATGPFGYIFKPFDDKQIYAMVETALVRHQMEAKLREGQRWLNAVLDGINDGVIALDNHGEIRFINPIARQLTGWSEIEILNRSLDDVFVFMDKSSHARLDLLLLMQAMQPNNTDSRIEGLLVSKDGRSTPVEAEISFIDGGADMVLVFRDITKHQEALREIRRKSQWSEALVETAARLNAQIELSSVLDTVCTICNQTLQASGTAVFLEDGTHKHVFQVRATKFQIADWEKNNVVQYKIPAKLLERILSKNKPVTIINEVQEYPGLPGLEFFKEQNVHTVGIAGLYRYQELIGALILLFVGDTIHLQEDVLMLLKGLADQATISITNASLFEQVSRGRDYQRALTTRLVEIQETERRHIARELHDQIGQVLTGLQFILESSKIQAREGQSNKITEAQEVVSGLIEQIREMSLDLRPSMLDDIGLLPTLQWHFERYTKQTGIKISFNQNGIAQRFLPEVETAVYRIVQEALTNVARYAKASEAFVQMNLQENVLLVEINDHGIGFDLNSIIQKTTAAGLTGMRERANMLGGYMVIRSAPGEGTKILVTLPLERKPVERRTRARDITPG